MWSNQTKHGVLYMNTRVHFTMLKATCVGQQKYKRKIIVYLSMAALSILYDFDSGICSSTVQKELIDAFPWQKWLCERARMLRCKYTLILFSYDIV